MNQVFGGMHARSNESYKMDTLSEYFKEPGLQKPRTTNKHMLLEPDQDGRGPSPDSDLPNGEGFFVADSPPKPRRQKHQKVPFAFNPVTPVTVAPENFAELVKLGQSQEGINDLTTIQSMSVEKNFDANAAGSFTLGDSI